MHTEVKANTEYSLQKDHSSYSRSDTSLHTIQRKDTLEKVRVVSNVSTRGWEPVIFPNVSSRLEQYPGLQPPTSGSPGGMLKTEMPALAPFRLESGS